MTSKLCFELINLKQLNIIDIRDLSEFLCMRIDSANHHPKPIKLSEQSTKNIGLICKNGKKSQDEIKKWQELNPDLSFFIIQGGIDEWVKHELPIINPINYTHQAWKIYPIIIVLLGLSEIFTNFLGWEIASLLAIIGVIILAVILSILSFRSVKK